MALPTFTSITPNSGPAGGRNVVTIIGTNFRESANIAYPVQVLFDGLLPLETLAISDTELRVRMGSFHGSGLDADADPIPKVKLTIQNVDDNGDLIPSESIDIINAYRFNRAAIRDPEATLENQIYRQIVNETIDLFKRQLLPEVSIGTSVDFGKLGSVTIHDAKLPAILLDGPRIIEDVENRHHWADFLEVEEAAGGPLAKINKFWPAHVANLQFDAVISTNSRREMYGLMQGLIEMFMRTPFMEIPVSFGDVNGTKHQFPFVLLDGPAYSVQDMNSDLLTSLSVFEVRWVPFRITEPVDTQERVEEADLQVFEGQIFEDIDIIP